MAKIMISAGEASGDVHAAALTREILKLDPTAQVYGMGGDGLRAAGGEVLFDIKDHGVMGLVEIIRKLPALFRLRSDFAEVMDKRRPDCLVTIDYPGFNMRLAKVARAKGIPVISFIAPSAWAWRKGRAKNVAKLVNKVAAIFPFEYEVYKEAGADVEFMGHPLVDIVQPSLPVAEAVAKAGKHEGRPLVLLLPGSRLQEIQRLLPSMLEAAKLMVKANPALEFVMPRAGTIPRVMLEEEINRAGIHVSITEGNNYDVMGVADVALAASGTVTLEAALCRLPSVIVYRTAPLTAFIVRRLLNIADIGLPNIVAGRHILPELLQEDATPAKMAAEVLHLLEPAAHAQALADLDDVKKRLGEPGAVRRVAELTLRVAGEKA
ncbi:MAG: lipid-A-disaccharide synthase [Acidaminococcaceae bacterium]